MKAPPLLDVLVTVDLGSNSFRLQVCRNENGQLFVLDSLKEMVRLGAGLDENKYLTEEAQDRALACLEKFGERIRDFLPEQVRVVATNTFRVAKNSALFITKAEKVLGFPIEVIGGREEARLIYLGVAHTLPDTGEKRLVVDIGGGSTEFIIGQGLKAIVTESLPLGCVSYSMRFFAEEKVTVKNFQATVMAARAEIQRITPALKKEGWEAAVGASGSARALRDVFEAQNEDSTLITLPLMQKVAQQVIAAGSVKKAKLGGLKSDRIEVFLGGLTIMTAVFEELKIDSMSITDAALRDGVLYDLIGRTLSRDIRDTTVTRFKQRYHIDVQQTLRVNELAHFFLKSLTVPDTLFDEHWFKFIEWASKLHEVGLSISHPAYHKHSAYIIANADMPGFSRKEQQQLALLMAGQRGNLTKMQDMVTDDLQWLPILALRLAVLFCRGRKDILLPENLHLVPDGKKVKLYIDQGWLKKNPLTASALCQEELQWRKIGRPVVVKGLKDE